MHQSRSHHPVPLGPSIRVDAGAAGPATHAAMYLILAGGRDVRQGRRHLDVPVSRRRQHRPDHRLPALRPARCRSCQAVLPSMAMFRKGQVHNIGGRDIRTQAVFVAGLFGVAALVSGDPDFYVPFQSSQQNRHARQHGPRASDWLARSFELHFVRGPKADDGQKPELSDVTARKGLDTRGPLRKPRAVDELMS